MNVDVAWWDAWYSQLANFILFHAAVAQEEGVDALAFNLNCCDLSLYPNAPADRVQRWEAIAAQWRSVYSGPVGYQLCAIRPCCNYFPADPYFNHGIADIKHVFEFLGVSVWAGLANSATPSQSLLDANAEMLFVNAIDPINTASGLPIVLPGLAFASYDRGATNDLSFSNFDALANSIFFPEGNAPPPYDGIVQAMAYQAILNAVARRPHVIGVYPFNYAWVAMPLSPEYSIRGKAAEPVVAAWYAAAAGLKIPPALIVTPGTGLLDFGNATDVTVTIQNTGGSVLEGAISASGAFSVTSGASVRLLAGASQAVTAHRTPNGRGLLAGNLTLTTNAGASRPLLIAGAFTDSVPTTMSTVVKLAHLLELRGLIDALRIRQGLAAFTWTDPNPVAGGTPVKRQHLIELRSALIDVYVSAGRTPPTFGDATVTAGATPIKAIHLAELRSAAQALD